jgi:crotonobetainyl-CoA:carnitine CoA-transferase CaiB-like acyl-CoA transferase
MSGWLSSYRVIDLCDERGLLAGHMLAQLGADVIQVEPPGGSPARQAAPFARVGGGEAESMYWAAYASGKRGLTCDLERPEGREALHRLLEGADFLFESFEPGVMARLGLDRASLAARHPHLVHVSITAFGSSGPKSAYHASDLSLWAAGGPLLPNRDADGTPLRISVPQSWLHGAADAAGGALVAHFARLASGRGQHVDISVQQSVAQATLSTILSAAVGHEGHSVGGTPAGPQAKKQLDLSGSGARTRRSKWRLADGLLEMHLAMGPAAGRYTNALFAWMRDEGACDAATGGWDWVTIPKLIESGALGEAEMEAARATVERFLASRSKADMMINAVQRKLLMAPIAMMADLAASPHHAHRGFFQEISCGAATLTLPGDFALGAAGAFVPLTPAPGIGEHNDAVHGTPRARRKPAPEHPDEPGPAAPFAGLKVLDLAWVVAGPLIGRTLADFGATVVHVESGRKVDTTRLMGPFPGGKLDTRQSALYQNCNAGKLGLGLDLSSTEGRQLVLELVGWADVVVESFAPGQMARWGLDYARLSEVKPDLVMVSTSLMGQTGPYAAFAGFGNLGAAVAGFQRLAGQAGAAPIGPFGPYTDYVGPRFGLVALLAALDQRRRTGHGCHLDVAQADAGIQFLAPQLAAWSADGQEPAAQGNRDSGMAPHGVFACREQPDGMQPWIAIAVRSDAEWRRLADLIGGPGLATDPRFTTLALRRRHEDALEALLAAWAAQQPVQAAETALQLLGIAAHKVASSRDMLDDPQLSGRAHFVRLDHPVMGTSTVEGARFRLSATPGAPKHAAPEVGADNRHVLSDLLGLSDARIAELQAAGVLA